MGAFASIALFPGTLLAALTLCWWMLARQVEPGLIVGCVSTLAIVVVVVGERYLPYRQDWRQSRQDIGTDILHNLLNSYGFREFCKVLLLAATLPAVAYLSTAVGASLWPQHWPLVLQVALALITAELGLYCVHRLCHENAFFWRFHMVHHSPERLYWLNAGRDHPLGVLLFVLAGSTPLILLGTPERVMLYYFVIEAVHGLFQHANIRLRFGPLNHLFSTAALHRWHHSNNSSEANHNYGQTLILWVKLFGTVHLPADRQPQTVGLEGMSKFPRTFIAQMLAPFRPYADFDEPGESTRAADSTKALP